MSLISNIEKCFIPALAKCYDECESHKEYDTRIEELEKHFDALIKELADCDLRVKLDESSAVLALLYILYKDLLTPGPWHRDKLHEYAKKLNVNCQLLYEIEIAKILKTTHVFNNQKIFKECVRVLHCKLTSTDFKRYPSLVEVYFTLIEEIEEYKDVMVDLKVFPISLYLTDDYLNIYKKKGLGSCKNILKHLPQNAFSEGNYYEVIYPSLKKKLLERDLAITKLVIETLMEFLKVLPGNNGIKLSYSQELYATSLDQILMESNLYRKVALFDFTTHLIQNIGIDAISRKTFNTAVCDNLDICCNDGVQEILLKSVLQCLEEWICSCWCGWKLTTGQKILSILIKLLYSCKDENTSNSIIKIVATLICLCENNEKENIIKNLNETELNDERFKKQIDLVIKYTNV